MSGNTRIGRRDRVGPGHRERTRRGYRSRLRVANASRVRDRRVMLAAWIETPAKGRNAGPVRAGMWSAVVIGSHPVQDFQRAWLEVMANDLVLGLLPAYWIENKAGNSFWHAAIPPQAVGTRLHYR